MRGGLSVNTKFDTNKNQVSVNPVNNINVNVHERSLDPSTLEGVTVIHARSQGSTPDFASQEVIYPDHVMEEENSSSLKMQIQQLEKQCEALKIIIDMMKNNPLLVNKLIVADDEKLAKLVLLLTDADDVTIDADDLGAGCCTANVYRKVNAIYVIKDGNTKNLKYDYPEITKELKELGINTKIVW